ncbi:hypothetical protein FOF48_19635 [Corallococcus sp. Z5C101001]|nr:hypothetical protein FOF48_19635 [Corallococcus sp. Z5C101001]
MSGLAVFCPGMRDGEVASNREREALARVRVRQRVRGDGGLLHTESRCPGPHAAQRPAPGGGTARGAFQYDYAQRVVAALRDGLWVPIGSVIDDEGTLELYEGQDWAP